MKVLFTFLLAGLLALLGCKDAQKEVVTTEKQTIRFEKILFYRSPPSQSNREPFQSRLTYYFDEAKPHRWMLLDSAGNRVTDYIYEYNVDGIQEGARYTEDYDSIYAPEKVRFENDSTQITEWVDSTGAVYYTMIDNLNKAGKTKRATFIGDTTHGYDSTFYTSEGFEKRIFFTNVKGKVYNDRSYKYDAINDEGDWTQRRKIMNDSVVEYQEREVYYDTNFTSGNDTFFEGAISTSEWDENVFSFAGEESLLFFTRTRNWQDQTGYMSEKFNGLFVAPTPLPYMDSLYNGAISPSGDRIIYSKRNGNNENTYLATMIHGFYITQTNLTENSGIEGGYFYWWDEEELYFYVPDNEGDIVQGELIENQLSITDSLSILNTKNATEFSPFVDWDKRFVIFTRYLEGDVSQQGFFVSYNQGTSETSSWTPPVKIDALPYGWNAYVTKDQSRFLYTDGTRIKSVPFEALGLKLNDQ